MLRFDFMPSDFNPMFLFLGSSEDLGDLCRLLRKFEQAPRRVSVREKIAGSVGRAPLDLVPAEGEAAEYGMRGRDGDARFEWVLNGWQAGQIAGRIEALLPAEMKSGNDIFELGVENEIPVKVSRGEFTEEFLTKDHTLHPDYVAPAWRDRPLPPPARPDTASETVVSPQAGDDRAGYAEACRLEREHAR